MSLPKPCLTCGTLSTASHCPDHAPRDRDRRQGAQRRTGRDRSHLGRTYAWDQLSKRARALQDWCQDCGARADLTTDHTPAAWAAILARRPVTLAMVEVVCRVCNSRRGPAIPGSVRWEAWIKAQSGALIGQNPGADQGVFAVRQGSKRPRVSPASHPTGAASAAPDGFPSGATTKAPAA